MSDSTASTATTVPPLQSLSLGRPILIGVALMAIALAFKAVDTFVLRLDERLGEIILSKSLGFGLVLWFTWAAGRGLGEIGLHRRRLGRNLLIGATLTVIAYAVGYGVEVVTQLGSQPALYVGAIDPKAGVTGGALFAAFLVVGNVVNAFMEEGLFRGLMLPLFRRQLSFWGANWLQAFLFGAWHLMWVVKGYQTGAVRTPGEIGFAAFSNFGPQLLMGLVWGYMYLKSGSLWGAWLAHFLTNSASNLLHVVTSDGVNPGFALRMVVYVVVALACMVLVRALSDAFRMHELQPWAAGGPRREPEAEAVS
jgi:membrane protease YdiL (CAAX protease family)